MQVGRLLASSSRAYPSDGDVRLPAALIVVRRDVALRAPDGLDHRLAWFVDSIARLSLPRIPSPIPASVASMPARSELAAPGCVWSSSSREALELLERAVVVGLGPRATQLVPAGASTPVFRTNSLPTPELSGIFPVGVALARAHDDQSLARRRPRVIDAERDELSEAQPGRGRMRNRGPRVQPRPPTLAERQPRGEQAQRGPTTVGEQGRRVVRCQEGSSRMTGIGSVPRPSAQQE